MIHRRKIKDVDDAIFAVKLIIKMYKKATPNDYDTKILIDYYNDALKIIQSKYRSTDLTLFRISDTWINFEFHSSSQYKEFKEELINKCEALKDFLESKIEKEHSVDKTIEQRIERLEKFIMTFDERLDYVVDELGALKNLKRELRETTGQNRKIKSKKSKK